MTALVTKHLPLVAGGPDGIRKLRVLIQQLAVQGRLIPKSLGWQTLKLADLGKWAVGSGFPTVEQGKKDLPILFCKVSDMNLVGNERFIRNTNHTIDEETAKRLRVNIHPAGTVVFPKIGGAISTNKRRILIKPSAIDNNCLGISPPESVSSDYLYLLLTSIDFTVYQAGTSVPALSQGVIGQIAVGLPTLIEQHRIVAKVDELMALCDRLEIDQADGEAAHAQLVQALLGSLTQATDAADFRASWQRLSEHFHALFATEASIDALKQTVLQLAMMGKIVKQDLSSTENGQDALKKIIAWRKQAVLSKEIREPRNPVAAIGIDEHPYELPGGWVWVRLGTLFYIQSGDGLTAANMRAGSIPVFGGNGVNGYHDECNVVSPTLVIGRVGYYCGSIHVTPENAWVTDNAFITKFCTDAVEIRFLYWLLKITNLKENDSATAQPVISGSKIYPIVVGLPPLEEQHRIVAKVDELMALCDQLKTQLTEARHQHAQLATVLVEQAVA